jgi:hypothetical protein
MKSRLITVFLACLCVSLARAQFNPVPLTQSSYTFKIVIPHTYFHALQDCINVTAGNGSALGDNTFFEQGLAAGGPGLLGYNMGIPPHNTVFTNINNPNITFLMPPDYTTNNELMVDQATYVAGGTITFNTPTTATNLAFLGTGGGGSITVNYTLTHSDNSTETGTITLSDWFGGGSTVAWGANGRVTATGGMNNINTSPVNNQAPYLYSTQITVSGATPITSITLSGASSGAHANFYAVSGNASGGFWTPIPLNQSSFNAEGTVPAAQPWPITATMDQGTNFNYNGNLNTWFEQGYDRSVTAVGLPPSGSTFSSQTSGNVYQLGNYSTNSVTLIDSNHPVANITPLVPAAYSTFAFLTAGGNDGPGMTNKCIIQHADGVRETNIFYGYDWFDQNHNGAIAYSAGGRVNMANRSLQNIGGNPAFPFLFETYFPLSDTVSPVTNIVVEYYEAPNTSATTYILAVSAGSGSLAPVITSGPTPLNQTVPVSGTANFAVSVIGTPTPTGYWQVENNGTFNTLADGTNSNKSTIIGSHTTSLTISNLSLADGTNYQYVAFNVAAPGGVTSPTANLIVSPQTLAITPANPVFYTSNNIPLTAQVGQGPALSLQWFYIDDLGDTNYIPGATNASYTIIAAPLSLNGTVYGIIGQNSYNTNTASVTLNISDSAAFLAQSLAPSYALAYVGAPVIYALNAGGNSPVTYQWYLNGSLASVGTSNTFGLAAPSGASTIQVVISNSLNNGISVTSSVVTLQGIPSLTNLTLNNGIGWQSNSVGAGPVPLFATNVLVLTDNTGSEASSTFLTNAYFVGGVWNASFVYNSHGGGADGAAFILQNSTNAAALGGTGSGLGYSGIGNSLSFQINLYNGNGETPGITQQLNGLTGPWTSAAPVSTTSADDINVALHWENGVLSAKLTDTVTLATYSTNYAVGSLVPILNGNLAYIGFSGGDGGTTAFQTISNFQFQTVISTVKLSQSHVVGGSFVLSWPVSNPNYQLQVTPSLSSPAWVAGPSPVVVNGTNQVSVSVVGSTQRFYRLVLP